MASSSDSGESYDDAQRLRAIKWNVHTPFQSLGPTRAAEISTALAIPCHLMLVNLDGNMNIAMSIRTAAVLGISDVWVVGKRRYDARPEVGAKNYIRVHKIQSLESPRAFFEEKKLVPFLVEQGGKPIEEYSFTSQIRGGQVPCFIMGSESHGIPAEWLTALADVPRLTISQYGLVRSLNVSIAASILLYEYLKQWRALKSGGH